MASYIYARTSTKDQNVSQQAELLVEAYPKVKAADVYQEQASGTTMDRVVLDRLLGKLQSGDEVIVYDMSRLNRNTADFLALVQDFKERNIGLIIHSLGGQQVDTRSATGMMILTVLAAADQMQVELMKEKQAIGIERARAEGLLKGRPASPKTEKACKRADELFKSGNMSKQEACKAADVGIATFYRYLKTA